MAENRGGAPRAAPPPRPTIALPPRSAYESLFRGGGVGGFGAPDGSPGPMTLVSSFFAEDPDSECRSLSQLTAGDMASPLLAVAGRMPVPGGYSAGDERRAPTAPEAAPAAPPPGETEKEKISWGEWPHWPLGVMVTPSPFFTVPPGLSPASLLESPSLFSPGPASFGISHQQALAHVTAEAAQASAQMHIQVECHVDVPTAMTSLTQPASSAVSSAPIEKMQALTSDTKVTTLETTEDSHSKQQSQPAALDKPADDGYSWRKYGQKQVKGSECPRSYYKCTHPKCPVKKKVERSIDGQVTEIIYKGQHNHQQPPPNKGAKESCPLPGVFSELNQNFDAPGNSETVSQGQVGNMNRTGEHMPATQTSRRNQESGQATTEQFSGSSDGEELGDAEVRMEEGNDIEHDPKRIKMDTGVIESSSSHRTVTEPRIIVQTTSEVDLLDDGYRWRKYGQKVVKGNPHPRSYYKCTNPGCNVRKHVERASTDPAAVITAYEGKHNHDVPAARNSSHSTAISGSATHAIQPRVQNLGNNAASLERTDFRSNNQQSVALQLKEEDEVT